MSDKVKLDDDGDPAECPRCHSDDLCICNDDGLECLACGCWFDCLPDGTLLYARDNHPGDVDG